MTRDERFELTQLAFEYEWFGCSLESLLWQCFRLHQLTAQRAVVTTNLRLTRCLPLIEQATVWELVIAVLEWNRCPQMNEKEAWARRISAEYRHLHVQRPQDVYKPGIFLFLEDEGIVLDVTWPLLHSEGRLRWLLYVEHFNWCREILPQLKGTEVYERWMNRKWS